MPEDTIMTVKGLTKKYGRRYVVRDLSIEVERGDTFAILGPNGAGKSTLIRMMLGLVWPDDGEVKIMGYSLSSHHQKALAHVGAIIESPTFYEYLPARTNLQIIGQLSGSVTDKMIAEAIEIVGLKGRERDKVSSYSYGMKQRLGIALTVLPKPELVILDEPTNGLDPQGIKDVRELIKSFPERLGITVFFASHLLHEVEQVANKVAIIDEGNLLVQAEVDTLIKKDAVYSLTVDDPETSKRLLEKDSSISVLSSNRQCVKLKLLEGEISDVNTLLVVNGVKVREIISQKETLENVFMKITS